MSEQQTIQQEACAANERGKPPPPQLAPTRAHYPRSRNSTRRPRSRLPTHNDFMLGQHAQKQLPGIAEEHEQKKDNTTSERDSNRMRDFELNYAPAEESSSEHDQRDPDYMKQFELEEGKYNAIVDKLTRQILVLRDGPVFPARDSQVLIPNCDGLPEENSDQDVRNYIIPEDSVTPAKAPQEFLDATRGQRQWDAKMREMIQSGRYALFPVASSIAELPNDGVDGAMYIVDTNPPALGFYFKKRWCMIPLVDLGPRVA
jgi:hypothetical protein